MVLELDGEHLTQKAEIKESFLEEVIPQASLKDKSQPGEEGQPRLVVSTVSRGESQWDRNPTRGCLEKCVVYY